VILAQPCQVAFHLPPGAVDVPGFQAADQAAVRDGDKVPGGRPSPDDHVPHAAADQPGQQGVGRRAGGVREQNVELGMRGRLFFPATFQPAGAVCALPQHPQIVVGAALAGGSRELQLDRGERWLAHQVSFLVGQR
jgi:hypothetical protein